METEKITAGWLKFIQMTGSGWAVKKHETWTVNCEVNVNEDYELWMLIVNSRKGKPKNAHCHLFTCPRQLNTK